MSRTYRKPLPQGHYTWGKPGYGKHYKRRLHKAQRQLAKHHGGKEHAVAGWMSECNWKGT